MNISINSAKNFILVNTFLISLSFFQYNCIQFFSQYYFSIFLIYLLRNYVLLQFIEFGTKNKVAISDDQKPIESYKYEFHYNVITTTAVESISHIIITTNMNDSKGLYIELLYFIPISFYFEIIFDFFHYFAHRLLHSKYLYKYLHKKHHKFNHPISIIAFYQEPFDLIITNSIPTLLSLSMVPNISYLQFNLIITYKNFVEISGHVGKKMFPTCSFRQFIWLPKLLEIELYTEDHDLHHSLNNCNYGKRFSLWDKLFGTYKSFQNQSTQ